MAKDMAPGTTFLGLYRYGTRNDPSGDFATFHELALHVHACAGMAPTHVGIEGGGARGKYTKAGGGTHRRAVKAGFSGVIVLDLIVAADASKPAYSTVSAASLVADVALEEQLVCLAFPEDRLPLSSEGFDAIVQALAASGWDFGFAGRMAAACGDAMAYVVGFDNGRQDQEQARQLDAWYRSTPPTRRARLRDVYPVNIINDVQRAGIERLCDTQARMRPLVGSHLWRWDVAPDAIEEARTALGDAGLLISR